jgi:hypothetical protein
MKYIVVFILPLLLGFAPPVAQAATPEQVDAAMEKAMTHLLAVQKNGNWESVTQPDISVAAEGSVTGSQFGGQTALATYALLCGGHSSTDPQLADAISFLLKTEPHGVYAAGFRCLVWSRIPLDKRTRPGAKRDFKYLLDAMHTSGPGRGEFGYTSRPGVPGNPIYDQSVSQIAVLGLWSLSRSGFEVPTSDWRMMDSAWRSHQYSDGSWPYYDSPKSGWNLHTASMTTAGIATLFILDQSLQISARSSGNPKDANIDLAFTWLGGHFDSAFQPIREAARVEPYTLFGLSRIGASSGYRRIGQIDWFQRASDYLCSTQGADGSWSTNYIPDVSGTSLGLLCLSYGRAPIVINKLQYRIAGQSGESEAHWNQRPQDCFNFVTWLGSSLESRLNWQIMDLDALTAEFQSSPILFISGNQTLRYTDAEKLALRLFVEQGGMILGNADESSEAFSKGFASLAAELFPAYELRELPEGHPIYVNEQFPSRRWKSPIRIKGVSNGVRELMLLPSADMSKAFQNQLYSGAGSELFELASDIVQYATDKTVTDVHIQRYHVVSDASAPIQRTVSIARLQYAGNWDPEPGGWRRLAAVMNNQNHTRLKVDAVKPGTGNLHDYKFAHLTGTDTFKLQDSDRAEIRQFIDQGGVLCIDAAGGSARFAASAEAELVQIFGPDARSSLDSPLPPESPIFTQPSSPVTTVAYRSFARSNLIGSLKTARLCGITRTGRLVALFSREDISAGLVGEPVDGVIGYSPESATAILRNIILAIAGDQK